MSLEPPTPMKPRGGVQMDVRKKIAITGHLSPPSTAEGGVQMNVERYEDVKMFSQSEPPPLNN